MNAIAKQTQLPAHLAHLAGNTALMGLNQSAAAGISAGGWPRISLKGSKFRLQQPNGEEFIVPQLFVDVIIVDANPHGVSKRFYGQKWDPNQEGVAPDCYSDNGIGPSNKSAKPQCATCAACPQNVWGSKISEATGKQVKACADTKKLAVLIAANTSGPAFELAVPADSMKSLSEYAKKLDAHGVPMSTVVTRVSFDNNASYPKINFDLAVLADGLMPYITVEQAQDVMDVACTEEVDNCTGKNDTPVDPARVGAAATTVLAQTPAQQYAGGPVTSSPPVPTQVPVTAGFPPIGGTPAALPPVASQPPAGSVAENTAPQPAKRTRKPRTATSEPAQQPQQGLAQVLPPAAAANNAAPVNGTAEMPAFLRNTLATTPNNADVTAPLQPSGVTNAALDDMLRKAMSV